MNNHRYYNKPRDDMVGPSLVVPISEYNLHPRYSAKSE